MFIFWNDHNCTSFGSVAKYVRCRHCSAEYGYVLDREVTGHAMSLFCLDEKGAAARAQDRAERKLQRALKRDVDPCPCPKCGKLQKDMVREAKRRYLRWMSPGNTILALCFSPVVFFISLLAMNALSDEEFLVPLPIFYGIWVGIIIAIALMPLMRQFLLTFYHPTRLSSVEMIVRGYYPGTLLENWGSPPPLLISIDPALRSDPAREGESV